MDLDNLETFFGLFSQWRFHVPDYQRGYAWGQDQWKDLLEDLDTLTDDNDHFTGLLVLHENHDSALHVRTRGIVKPIYDVVDGQQRLTTVVILLNELRREMASLGIEDLTEIADSIADTYLYEPGPGKQIVPKLVLDANNDRFFTHNVLGIDGTDLLGAEIQSHTNMQAAGQYFRDYLLKMRKDRGERYPGDLERLYDKIAKQMKVMVYRLRSEADAGVVFESMNNRGKKPNNLDLVKNYLLYLASKLGPDCCPKLTQEINQAWTTLFKQLSAAKRADDEESLLQNHWITIYDYDRRHWHGSDSVKQRFPLVRYLGRYDELYEDLEKYILTLQNASVAFCDASAPDQDSFQIFATQPDLRKQIIRTSQKLVRMDILRPFLPLLIAIRLRYPDDAQMYLDAIQLCELYAFRVFRIAGKRPNNGETLFFRLANQLFDEKMHFSDVQDAIRRDLLEACSDALFAKSFDLDEISPWYVKISPKYFLYEYEEHLFGTQAPVINWETIFQGKDKTIEHILPQNPEDQGYWADRFTPEQREKYKHMLGNLTLTEDNSYLGRKSFTDKKGMIGLAHRCYANSNLRIERDLAGIIDWTPTEIEKRQRLLAEWALDRWHVEAPASLPDDSFEALKARAMADGFGDAFMAMYSLAKRLRLLPKANKYRMSYKSPRKLNWSVLMLYTYANGIEAWINFDFFPHYPTVTVEKIKEIFGNKSHWWLTADKVPIFISQLEQLVSEVEGKSAG